jgi:hypothetical protein
MLDILAYGWWPKGGQMGREVYMKIKQLLYQGFKVNNIARDLEISRTKV